LAHAIVEKERRDQPIMVGAVCVHAECNLIFLWRVVTVLAAVAVTSSQRSSKVLLDDGPTASPTL
jgi:hypothetical protein